MSTGEFTPRIDAEPPADAEPTQGHPWLTNQNNSVNGADAGSLEYRSDRELPRPEEVARSFREQFRELSKLPLTRQHGRAIRTELLESVTETGFTDAPLPTEDSFEIEYEVGRNPLTWGYAVAKLLEDHEEARRTTLHLERGRPDDPEHAEHDVPAETRFMASYQKKYFAQMNGWFRETVGVGERPSGESPDGIMDDPVVVLLTRSASSTPGGDRLAPVDHFDALRESWSDVYHTLRNNMRALGLESGDDWQYDRRLEPHGGNGSNACYPHEHVVLVIDDPELSLEELRPVVEAHVDACEPAGEAAHDLDIDDWNHNREDVGTVEIRYPEQIDNLAAYVCDYASIEPADLLERSVEYVAFAAAAWATATRTITRSDPAVHASKADACKQRYEDAQTNQDTDHGEEILRQEIRGKPVLVCKHCKTPHGIDQSQTLTAARSDGSTGRVAADGGHDFRREYEDRLREKSGTARSAWRLGESMERRRVRKLVEQILENATEELRPREVAQELVGRSLPVELDELLTIVEEVQAGFDPSEEVISIERPPEWRLDAVSIDDETHQVSSDSGGVDLQETDLTDEHLYDWIRRNTDLEAMAEETKRILLYKQVPMYLDDLIKCLARDAGPHLENLEQLIEEEVSQPSRPYPRMEQSCWHCVGTYEYQGQLRQAGNHWSVFECWNCGDTIRIT